MVIRQFKNPWVPTRLCSVRWVNVLHMKDPVGLEAHLHHLFGALLKLLSDPAEEVSFFSVFWWRIDVKKPF
jgi:hypothetical protein